MGERDNAYIIRVNNYEAELLYRVDKAKTNFKLDYAARIKDLENNLSCTTIKLTAKEKALQAATSSLEAQRELTRICEL